MDWPPPGILSYYSVVMQRPGLILLPPCTVGSNAFLKNLKTAMEQSFDLFSMAMVRQQPWLLFSRVRVLYVNWIENGATVATWLQLLLLRALGVRIIWAFHNKMPHHGRRQGWTRFFMRSLAGLSHAIIIHSRESINYLPAHPEKARYFPLGNYIGSYPPPSEDLRAKFGIPTDHMVFVSLGALKRYKNIEMLIRCFRQLTAPDVHLIIAGQPESPSYAEQINSLAAGDARIRLELHYIPDDRLREYLNAADLMVFPLNQDSSLNSSAIILAFSYAKTVLAPRIGTLRDYAGQPDFFYAYDYTRQEDHPAALLAAMRQAYKDHRDTPNRLREWGHSAREYVRKGNDWRIIGEGIIRICQS